MAPLGAFLVLGRHRTKDIKQKNTGGALSASRGVFILARWL